MTTKTKTPKWRADNVRPETLEQFSELVDAYLGEAVGFADHVLALREVRADITCVTTHRKVVNGLIKAAAARGETRVLAADGDGGWEVRQSAPTPITVVKAVPSEVAKKYAPGLYAAAKAPKPFVQVKAHPALPNHVSSLQLPAVPVRGGLAALIAHLKSDLPSIADLQEIETEHREALDKIGANAGWDGLPIEFADRWLVGLRRLQYDSDRLREIDPKAWERLAVTKPSGGVSRLVIASLDPMQGALDLDGE